MRMKKLLTFLTLLTLFFTTAWAETVTLSWAGNGKTDDGSQAVSTTTIFSASGGGNYDGDANVATCTDAVRVYAAKSILGLKLGSGSNTGTMTFSINGSLKPTKITVQAQQYNTSDKTLKITANNDNNISYSTTSLTGSLANYELTMDGNTTLNTITVETTSKRAYVKSITITYGGSTTQTVATPTFSPAAGTYSEAQNVTISCGTTGATIYYTTDGNDPTTESEVYNGAITVSETTTIKAIAVKEGMNNSTVASATYTITAPLTSLAAVNALARYTEFTYGAETVVMGVYGNTKRSMYIVMPDNTAGTLIYGAENAWADGYTFGQVIKSGWSGKKDLYNTKPEIVNPDGFELKGETAEVTPITITSDDDLTLANFGRYAVVKNVSVGTDGSITDLTTYNQFGTSFSDIVASKKYNVYGVIGWHNSAGQFMPLSFEEVVEDPGDGYYLAGTFNNWAGKDARYKFSGDGTSLTLNNVTLPDDVQFKIIKWEGTSETWYGGLTGDENQQNPYGLHREWHTDIPLTNSYNNNKVKNFYIAGGAVTNFTLDTENLKFTVQRDAQLYFKCDKINNWEKIAMTATETGWTYSRELEAGAKFGFSDEWGDHHGNDWTLKPEHFGYSYDIPVGTENTYIMQDAGNYKLDVNSDLTVLHVNKVFNINCSANPNGGGTVVAKVNDQTVQSAMSGETVTIEYTTNNGYTFNNITLNGTVLEATEGVYSFVMPSQDAEVVANYTAQSFSITVESEPGEFGTVTCPETATTGQIVTFTVTPDEGYEVLSVTASFVIGENNSPVTVSYNEETEEYSFGMPPFPVTVKVTYKEPLQPCTIPFVETWDGTVNNDAEGITGCTGGNDNLWNGSIATGRIISDNEGWEYVKEGGAFKCIKLGTAKTGGGSATTPEILVSNGTIYKMTFRSAAWNAGSETTTLSLSAEGATLYENENCEAETELSSVELVKGEWTTYTVYVKATSDKMRITWYTSQNYNRFFLDDVNIPKPEPVDEPTSVTLAELCATGVKDKDYIIADKLQAVYAYTKGGNSLLWCKDLGNQSIYPTTIHSGQIDFMRNTAINWDEEHQVHNGQQGEWDQSNWIVLQFTNPTGPNNIDQMLQNAQDKFIKPGTIKGKLVDDENYILKMDLDMIETLTPADEGYDEEPYNENVYCPANFLPDNLNIHGGIENGDGAETSTQNYFFMNPKVQEVCYITYAQWNEAYSCFTVPSTSGIPGAFQVGWVYQDKPGLENGHIYKFHAVVHRVGKQGYGPNNPITTKDDEMPPIYENITVLPVDLDPATSEIITSINTVETGNGEVKSVKYVNVAGIMSDRPFQGVNIVVTEYTDGSRTTTKMLKK